MNVIFMVLIVGSVLTAAFTGNMKVTSDESLEAAKRAVTVAISLLGAMTLWLGFMRVLQDAGILRSLSRALAPLMRRLFPDVPSDHPAMGAMILNIAANMLGLGNAATPFGLKAMQELNKLNQHQGVATNAMVLFLAINTSGVAVFPLGVIAIRSGLDSQDPAGIILPSILATAFSTLVGILVVKLLQNRSVFSVDRHTDESEAADTDSISDGIPGMDGVEQVAQQEAPPADPFRLLVITVILIALVLALGLQVFSDAYFGGMGAWDTTRGILSGWLLPLLMTLIVLFGFAKHVKVYESVVKGAREGFQIFVMIIPFLVAILVAVGMFRSSGAMDGLIAIAQPLTGAIGFPAEALPMALVRPLSGSGAMGVMTETMTQHGPDSFVGFLVSVMNGSTETTFYVLALYFGSIQIRAMRHALIACLSADLTGMLAALFWSVLFYT